MTGLASRVLEVPSARIWIQGVAHALAIGESAFSVFPETVDPAPIIDAVVVAADLRGCTVAEIDIATSSADLPLLVVLAQALGMPKVPETPEQLVALDGLPSAIRLFGFDGLPAHAAERWARLIERTARASKAHATLGLAILCPVATHTKIAFLPTPAPHLQIHWWLGTPSAAELVVVCRGEHESTDPARQSWREHLLSSLAGSDAALAESFWRIVFEPTDIVGNALRAYATGRGWTSNEFDKLGIAQIVASPLAGRNREPPRERELWALGAVVQTQEFGLELHSAALALLGRDGEWIQRVWRGQASLVLPVLEDLRVRICQKLTATWGSDWPLRWYPPQSEEEYREVTEDPQAASWGLLTHLYRSVPALARDTGMAALVARGRHIRNELAHNRPILFPDYKALHDRAAELVWPPVRRPH
jgi:hypothetical protein